MTPKELINIIQAGEGLTTEFKTGSQKLPKTLFEFIDGDIFSTVIYLNGDTTSIKKTREKTREKIIRLMQDNSTVTINELADLTGISVKGIEYHISKLKKENYLVREGGDKGGRWKIVNDNNKQ